MVLAFMAVGALTILAVVLIVLALVFYLVSVILQLSKITSGLDDVITVVDMQELFREAKVPRKRLVFPTWLQKALRALRRLHPYRKQPPGTSGPELPVSDSDRPATPKESEDRDTD